MKSMAVTSPWRLESLKHNNINQGLSLAHGLSLSEGFETLQLLCDGLRLQWVGRSQARDKSGQVGD